MTWEVRSRTDPTLYLFGGIGGDGAEFTADAITEARVRMAGEQGLGLSPVGPFLIGIDTPAKLRAAAEWVIPAPRTTGDAPALPATALPTTEPTVPGVVY